MFGECTELAKKKLAELLANLRDEVHERMPGLNKFSFGTVNEGCKGTNEREERWLLQLDEA